MSQQQDSTTGRAIEHLHVCEHCDTVHRCRPLAAGEVAHCARCGAELEHNRYLSINTRLALTCTALIAFIIANAWPVLTLGFNGQYSSTTVWGTIVAMWQANAQLMALAVALMLMAIPLMQIFLTAWVLWFARKRRAAPGFGAIMITLRRLKPWSMSEVFVLGLLVCIVKAGAYFDLVLEPGLFGYAVLMVVIIAFANLDMRPLWRLVKVTGERA